MLNLGADEVIPLDGGELRYCPDFLDPAGSETLFEHLKEQTPWEQSRLRIAGRSVAIPRLNAWYGDEGAHYSYSGTRLVLHPWTPALDELRRRVCERTGADFNSALLNFYRDGRDSVDWHGDDEPELGLNPIIAAVSLGATRRFELKHRQIRSRVARLELAAGSLLVMQGALQHHWLHRVPKELGVERGRISITFRKVHNTRR